MGFPAVREDSVVSPVPNQFGTLADMRLINDLMKNSRYEIPEHLRHQVISSAGKIIENPESRNAEVLAASKVILEADKRNMEMVKMCMPKVNVNFNPKQATTEELETVVRRAIGLVGNESDRNATTKRTS